MKPQIHDTAIIKGEVFFGNSVQVGAYCILIGPLLVGDNTRIHSHCVIGDEPEYGDCRPGAGRVVIGHDCTIRSFTTIDRGVGERDTYIGNQCYLMNNAHVGHDAVIEDNVRFAPRVVIGGHASVLEGTTFGIGAMVLPKLVIGSHCMIGMGSVVTKNVMPFSLTYGNPAKFQRVNHYKYDTLVAPEQEKGSDIYGEYLARFSTFCHEPAVGHIGQEVANWANYQP